MANIQKTAVLIMLLFLLTIIAFVQSYKDVSWSELNWTCSPGGSSQFCAHACKVFHACPTGYCAPGPICICRC